MSAFVTGILCLLFVVIGYRHKRYTRRLPLGRFVGHKRFVVEGIAYDVEEVAFSDYQAAIRGYFRLVPVVLSLGKVCEERYDFFDFYSVAIRFEHSSVRLLRLVDKVRLVQSRQAVDLDTFAEHLSRFAYQDLKKPFKIK